MPQRNLLHLANSKVPIELTYSKRQQFVYFNALRIYVYNNLIGIVFNAVQVLCFGFALIKSKCKNLFNCQKNLYELFHNRVRKDRFR